MEITVLRIKELAENKGLTIRELAELSGCSKSAMQRYLSNERDIPTNIVTGIAKALSVHPAYLLGWVNDKDYSPQITKQPAQGELSYKKREFIKKVEAMSEAQIEKLEQILSLVESTKL